jgi:hypothetical protein
LRFNIRRLVRSGARFYEFRDQLPERAKNANPEAVASGSLKKTYGKLSAKAIRLK